jgi:hypothetical protein
MVLAILLLIPGFFAFRAISVRISKELNPQHEGRVRVDRYRDLNDRQLVYAKRHGIKPFKTNKDFQNGKDELLNDGELQKVKNGKYFVIEKLGYSYPYLVPKAINLLEEIGKRFRKKLDEHGKGKYYFKVSSLLRTQESQKSLSRSNKNASPNSTHLYGTTFDIAYSRLVKKPFPWIRREVADATAIKLLSEVIGELRREGQCLVVTEYQEKCFHITVAK